MKHFSRKMIRNGLPLLLLFGLLLDPYQVLAALGVISVQPNVVSNVSSVDLVVTGADFVDGAVVVVENFGALTTNFVSTSVLTAMLPAGLAPGVYTITVVNPDSASASLPNGLTVAAPTATQPPSGELPTPTPFLRPLVVVDSYGAGGKELTPGMQFDLLIKLQNAGQRTAHNLVVTFSAGDLIPRATGGVLAIAELPAGEKKKLEQPFTASSSVLGKAFAQLTMQVAYTDSNGTAYTDTFSLSVPVAQARPGSFVTATPTFTPTPTQSLRPQLVISGYETDIKILQPGSHFLLNLQIQNVGNAIARRVSMIVGGGSSSSGGSSGTPEPGGVSGGSGDFGTFAPVASSNVQFIGDISAGAHLSAKVNLIVNASVNPGAYPMKISFSYEGASNSSITDDQVITLLIYSLPQVEVNFYRDPGPVFAGQGGQLPLQVVNLGRKTTILGNMRVNSSNGQLQNNVTLVGVLDPGGYFTMDAVFIPEQSGPTDLLVTIDYTDDFNASQVITKTIAVEVMEAPIIEPGPEGPGSEGGVELQPVAQPETVWQKAWRFVLGLLGLDSGRTTSPEALPPSEAPPGDVKPVGPQPGPKG